MFRRPELALAKARVHGVSTRSIDDLAQAMGMTGISKSSVLLLCAEIGDKISALLTRPLEGRRPPAFAGAGFPLWLDAAYVTLREKGASCRLR